MTGLHQRPFPTSVSPLCFGVTAILACSALGPTPGVVLRAEDHPGAAIYREHCLRCHGEDGAGTEAVPAALAGDRSVDQLTGYVHDTMPEDDPTAVTGEAARLVSEWIHAGFYSAVARDRNRPARLDLARLTVRQHKNAIADLVAGFSGEQPPVTPHSGLRGQYYQGRDFNDERRVFDRLDGTVNFDFGVEGPDPERFTPGRFAIRWQGSIVPVESGVHEFIVRTEHAVRLLVNHPEWDSPALIDAWVKSGDDTEYRGSIHLLGGRAYPLRLEFSKASQGVDNPVHERPRHASIELLWKQPHGVVETVPARNLIPARSPATFVVTTPFPPDDRSIGYERGSTVSKEWLEAVEGAATETAAAVRSRAGLLAGVGPEAPDRKARLRAFAATFAERAFRRPLDPELAALVLDRPFAESADADTALERSLLLVLSSPRFLFREPPVAGGSGGSAPWDTASRLAFAVWDSLPDGALRDAAARGALATPDEVAAQVRRMLSDRKARAKLRDFLLAWLRVDQLPEIVKDPTLHPGFTPEVAADLRTSLELLLDDCLAPAEGPADFRRLFTAEEVYLNGRLAPLFGVDMPATAGFRPVRLDDGKRAGVLTHPYMMSVLSYAGSSSPIHRGVFLYRSVLGNVLKPPAEAVAALAPDLHPGLSTRDRITLQTSPVSCQVCHAAINPLGFALEEYDSIGRRRSADGLAPVDAAGSYLPRGGAAVSFVGGKELSAFVATSRDAEEAFLQALFHAEVRQPLRAWGPGTLEELRRRFESDGCDIRAAVVDIMRVAAFPPAPSGADLGNLEKSDDHAP
jgi:hypothetical protein